MTFFVLDVEKAKDGFFNNQLVFFRKMHPGFNHRIGV